MSKIASKIRSKKASKKRKRTKTVSLKIQYILNKFYFQMKLYNLMIWYTIKTSMRT